MAKKTQRSSTGFLFSFIALLGFAGSGFCFYEAYLVWGDPSPIWVTTKATLAYAWILGGLSILAGLAMTTMLGLLGSWMINSAHKKKAKKKRPVPAKARRTTI